MPENSFDKEGVQRKKPTIIIAPDQSWTQKTKPDGTLLYPTDKPIPPILLVIQWAHEVAHLLRKDGVADIFAEKVKSAADAVALTLLGEGVALWNEYLIAKSLGLQTIHSGKDIFDGMEKITRNGEADLQAVGNLYRNKKTSTYTNLTYEEMAVIQWAVVRKLGHKNWQELDLRAIKMGETLHIGKNADGTYSIKGEVPFLPRKQGRTPPPLKINEASV